MAWNNVDDIAAPTDRVIEVTSGGAWVYDDYYYGPTNKHRPNTTMRSWNFQGGVKLVIWRSAEDVGQKTGMWLDTQGGIFPGFKFWREYENPLEGLPGYITQTTPPHPFNEKFEGDARLRLYDDIEADARKSIAWAADVIDRDVRVNRTPNPTAVRSKGMYEERLAQVLEARLLAYDPYDLPENVRGKAKSG